jgi:hypothetical protein
VNEFQSKNLGSDLLLSTMPKKMFLKVARTPANCELRWGSSWDRKWVEIDVNAKQQPAPCMPHRTGRLDLQTSNELPNRRTMLSWKNHSLAQNQTHTGQDVPMKRSPTDAQKDSNLSGQHVVSQRDKSCPAFPMLRGSTKVAHHTVQSRPSP